MLRPSDERSFLFLFFLKVVDGVPVKVPECFMKREKKDNL